jgi:hypothetical protein
MLLPPQIYKKKKNKNKNSLFHQQYGIQYIQWPEPTQEAIINACSERFCSSQT